jgi:AcrR family transcriptional regulator
VSTTTYESSGRVAQKRRTRDALVAAARQLVADGHTPTVEAAAAAASVSRTTAYRYFPSQRLLLAAAHPETAADSMLPEDAPEDVAGRVDLVVAAFTRMIVDTEAQQRTMLRLSLEGGPEERAELPLRQGRAIKWLEEALAPLRTDLPAGDVHRLAVAIRSATGIEALVWLTDIAGLTSEEAVELLRWSAQAMVEAARRGAPPVATASASRRATRRRASG